MHLMMSTQSSGTLVLRVFITQHQFEDTDAATANHKTKMRNTSAIQTPQAEE